MLTKNHPNYDELMKWKNSEKWRERAVYFLLVNDKDELEDAIKDEDRDVREIAYYYLYNDKRARDDASDDIKLNACFRLGFTKKSLQDDCYDVRLWANRYFGFPKESMKDETDEDILAEAELYFEVKKLLEVTPTSVIKKYRDWYDVKTLKEVFIEKNRLNEINEKIFLEIEQLKEKIIELEKRLEPLGVEKEVLKPNEFKCFYVSKSKDQEQYKIIQKICFQLGYRWFDDYSQLLTCHTDKLIIYGYDNGLLGWSFSGKYDYFIPERRYSPDEFITLHKHLLDN